MTDNQDNQTPEEHKIDEQERIDLLQRDGLLLVIVLLCLANGMVFSPFFDYALLPVGVLTQSIFEGMPLLVTYVTSLLLSTFTLMVSGIPAALFEANTGRTETDRTSCLVWLAGAFVLAMPSLWAFFKHL